METLEEEVDALFDRYDALFFELCHRIVAYALIVTQEQPE